MGEVFRARRLSDGQAVVIKRVLPALAAQPGFVDRFLHEVRVLARLDAPSIVRVFDFGEVDGRWYLAMEHVDGVDLATTLKQGPLPLTVFARVALDGAAALIAAHGARDASGRATPVVHRDVSPHNLLLAADGRVKLIDFGVASLTGQGESGGKVAYAAPEQLLEDETSPASDQYSFGVVLWEALAGRSAFDGDEDVELLRQVTEGGVPSLPTRVAPELAAIVRRMTALSPSDRFANLQDVQAALAQQVKALRLDQRPSASSLQPVASAPEPVRAAVKLNAVETKALALLTDGMTAEEAESAIDAAKLEGQPFALDLLQALVEAGALQAAERDGARRFFRAAK
jgi:serine/threonine-protein kinase